MKKRFSLLLCAILCLSLLCGCSGGADGNTTLRVAMSPDYAPMEFVDPTREGQDQFVGFDVSLSKYLAEEMGLTLQIVPMSFDACQTAVAMGQVDLAISGFSWLPDREEKYNLSDTYHAGENESTQVLLTTPANAALCTDADSLAGQKIGAQTASLQEWLVQQQIPGAAVIPYGDIATGIMQLKKGDFVAIAVADGNANAILAGNPELCKAEFRFVMTDDLLDNLILLQKGNDELTETVNALLAKAEAAGLYELWYAEALELAVNGVEVSYEDEPASTSLMQILRNVRSIWSSYWQIFLFEGVKNTLILTVIAVVLGVLLGTLVAMAKMSRSRLLRFLISIYIELIRGTPILLQLYIFYFVLPEMMPFLNLSGFLWVAIALCINSSAYVSEVIRSGIQAVDKGQTEAARCLGLSQRQTMLRIILPQAVRNILPALGNEFIMILKETSLASTFFLGDLMTSYLKVKGATYLGFETLLIVGCIYFLLTFPLSKLVAHFEKKLTTNPTYRTPKRKKVH